MSNWELPCAPPTGTCAEHFGGEDLGAGRGQGKPSRAVAEGITHLSPGLQDVRFKAMMFPHSMLGHLSVGMYEF
jgi:hypothetical protein